MTETVQVIGQVYKVQTLVDGGIRVTFDLPETAIKQMAQLAQYQIDCTAVKLTVKPNEG